jgi:DUF438 domain-containing protein
MKSTEETIRTIGAKIKEEIAVLTKEFETQINNGNLDAASQLDRKLTKKTIELAHIVEKLDNHTNLIREAVNGSSTTRRSQI